MQRLTLAGIIIAFLATSVGAAQSAAGPCAKEKLNAGAPMPGKFIPQCTDHGFYKPIQCHASTGYCWCANPDDGKKLESAGMFRNREVIRCPMCHLKRAESLRGDGLVGGYVPQCEENGRYKTTQHHGSTGHSWCVDPRTGDEVQGTRIKAGEGKTPDCETIATTTTTETTATAPPPTRMQLAQQQPQEAPCKSTTTQERRAKLGAYRPQCTENGYFRTTQVHGSTGYSWCVNPATGVEIPSTRRGPTETGKLQCGHCFEEMETALTPKMRSSTTMPQCNQENGDYLPTQFREGYKFCVHTKTGALSGKIHPAAENIHLQCDK